MYRITYLSLVSLERRPFPGPLVGGSRCLLGLSLVCTHWCFPVAYFFSSESGIHEVKRKSREFPTVAISASPGLQSICHLLSTFHGFIHNAQSFQLCLAVGIQNITSAPSSWEQKSVSSGTNHVNMRYL